MSEETLNNIWEFLGGAVLVILGFWLGQRSAAKRSDESMRAHIDALGMEIRYCGKLAAEYAKDNVIAPLYRLPDTFYKLAVPELLREGLLTGNDTDVLQRFYGQADQVNRGLDIVDGLVREVMDAHMRGRVEEQRSRLTIKVNDMRSEGLAGDASVMYRDAVAAHTAIFWRWQHRSWWRRFKRKRVRPVWERLRLW
jgi:hypothetical protein